MILRRSIIELLNEMIFYEIAGFVELMNEINEMNYRATKLN